MPMPTTPDDLTGIPARSRTIPWIAVTLTVASFLWLPMLALVATVAGVGQIGLVSLLSLPLGLLAATVAGLDRRLTRGEKLAWGTTAFLVGLFSWPLWWSVGVALWGP